MGGCAGGVWGWGDGGLVWSVFDGIVSVIFFFLLYVPRCTAGAASLFFPRIRQNT